MLTFITEKMKAHSLEDVQPFQQTEVCVRSDIFRRVKTPAGLFTISFDIENAYCLLNLLGAYEVRSLDTVV